MGDTPWMTRRGPYLISAMDLLTLHCTAVSVIIVRINIIIMISITGLSMANVAHLVESARTSRWWVLAEKTPSLGNLEATPCYTVGAADCKPQLFSYGPRCLH